MPQHNIALLAREGIVFLLVGIVTLAIELGSFYLLSLWGMPHDAAAALSFLVPSFFNYYGHCLLTFGKSPSLASAARYAASVGINGVIHMSAFAVANHVLLFEPLWAKLAAMAVSIASNFCVQKFFTFKD